MISLVVAEVVAAETFAVEAVVAEAAPVVLPQLAELLSKRHLYKMDTSPVYLCKLQEVASCENIEDR